jgi:long-chain acyl-CoA synthetase
MEVSYRILVVKPHCQAVGMAHMRAVSKGIVSGDRLVTHEEREWRSRQIAGGLKNLGISRGDCVAILMRNDIAFLEATFGAMMLGAYAVPINWHFKAEEIAYILADCNAKVLIGHSDLLHGFGHAPIPKTMRTFWVLTPPEIVSAYKIRPADLSVVEGATEFTTWIADQSPYLGSAALSSESMIYTSGTTGRPKGVRRNAPTAEEQRKTDQWRSLAYGVKPGARALLPGPLYHISPNALAVRAARMAELLVLMPRFDAQALLSLIEREQIDTVFMVPTMFARLLQLPPEARSRYDLSSLRHVVHTAAPCPPDLKEQMIDWWGPVIHEFYGSTEAGVLTLATSQDALLKRGTVGRCIPGVELRIYDDDGNILPPGRIGEIYGRCDGYPDFTYHRQPDKRAAVERDGLITSGDVGYLDNDGYLFICDRKRDMVISGGVNIYPAEIESLLHSLPGVHDCAVFGIPDEEFGEALMAVVEPLPGASLDPAVLAQALRSHLANYKVPKRIELRTDLPREDSGKIFKRRLRNPYWERAGRLI